MAASYSTTYARPVPADAAATVPDRCIRAAPVKPKPAQTPSVQDLLSCCPLLGATPMMDRDTRTQGDEIRCRNCGRTAGPRFCAHCGQEVEERRGPVLTVLREVLSDWLSLDSRLLRSLRALLVPGRLTGLHLDGKRAPYVRPFRLYLLASLVLFSTVLAPRWSGSAFFDSSSAAPHGTGLKPRARIPSQADHPFRRKPTTRSGASRPPVPAQADHPFRRKPTTWRRSSEWWSAWLGRV